MSQPDRPVRLTFPSYDVGAARIMAGSLQVGHVLGEFWLWRAYLWPVADDFSTAYGGEQATGKRLEDLRACLRERVRTGGPWWAAGHPDGIERGGLCEVPGDEERSDEQERP